MGNKYNNIKTQISNSTSMVPSTLMSPKLFKTEADLCVSLVSPLVATNPARKDTDAIKFYIKFE